MEQKNMDIAKYILQIIKSRPMVMMSWGFNSATVIKNGLAFKVNGFKHRGWCEVIYNEGTDTFTFRTTTQQGKVKKELDDVYMDNLVDVIDRNVETGCGSPEQYRTHVVEWLETCFS